MTLDQTCGNRYLAKYFFSAVAMDGSSTNEGGMGNTLLFGMNKTVVVCLVFLQL